ncbi:hypothetical protein PFMALIP_02036, partial [Plasmodium falciparum MaliPS096_E11]
MARDPRGGGSEEDDIDHKSVKHLLDSIGKIVHEQVKTESETYKDDLKGLLTSATLSGGELAGTDKPCDFKYDKLINGSGSGGGAANSERHPCKNLKGNTNEERFSNTLGGQCTREKISGSTSTCGACAPYRRLHLCHHNLESIDTKSTKHDLLVEVCMAAKYEGEILTRQHGKHKLDNNNSSSQLCTVLARSFADIGDIVRGRDLYRGNDKEKDQRKQLKKNLKTIFEKIKGNNNSTLNGLPLDKVREYWWDANRATIWEAITCGVHGSDYFRATCGGDGKHSTLAKNNCRCKDEKGKNDTDQVPTYFDYVPQYLRWFEEWAEDFCRKRKHKLKDVIEKCRGENGTERYCDLNRHDCVKTIRGDHDFVEHDECHKCSVACAGFVKWIDNQKLEFLKQRKKYETEISDGGAGGKGRTRKKRDAGKSNYDGYEKKFYDELNKREYRTVDEFLKLLNKEDVCTKNNGIEDGGTINFKTVDRGKNSGGDGNNKTFYRTTYCEACPWCGVEPNGQNGKWKWEAKDYGRCNPGKGYTNYQDTKIPILTGDTTKSDMVQKYNKFCNGNGGNGREGGVDGSENGAASNSDNATTGYCGTNIDSSLCEKWTCYYKKKENSDGKDINFCVLQDDKARTSEEKSMHYNSFFWDWVYHMLHDSLDWRKQLGNCINKDNDNTCRNNNKCKTDCGCFQKWVEKKQQEWMAIKDHFYKQEDIRQEGPLGSGLSSPDFVLELLLKKDLLLESIKDTHADAKEEEIKNIQNMLQQAGAIAGGSGGENKNTSIDKFLEKELKEAEDCLRKQNECEKKKQKESPARSAETREDERTQQPADSAGEVEEEEDEDEDDEDEVEEGDHQQQQEEETPKEDTGPQETQLPDACTIVAKIFEDDKSLKEACGLKYGTPNRYWGWRCVAPSGSNSDNNGATCIPPRRRRLYIQKLHDWANETLSSGEKSPGDAASSTETSQTSLLRDAFIQSAAVETFFLWDRYKEEKKKPQGDVESIALQLPGSDSDDSDPDPQTQLQSGTIPNDFLRQMFYTLGDYRDICVGVKQDVIKALKASGDKNIDTINEKIEKILNSDDESSRGPKKNPSENPRKTWWQKNGEHIWNGMICALTYDTNTASGTAPKQNEDLKKILMKKLENNGKENGDYHYEKVELKEENETKAKGPQDGLTPQTTHLSKFVLRPPYFRYLEEWGQNFCKERKKRLKQIKVDCKVEGNGPRGGTTKQYSGDGETCNEVLPKNDGTVHSLEGQSCADSCKSYKKWIQKKKIEFEEQSNAYSNQKENCKKESKSAEGNNHGNEFCVTVNTCNTAAAFLQKLGPCKKDNDDNEIGEGKKIFDDKDKTFVPATNCKPCSQFKIDCQNGNCGADTNGKCNGKTTITANHIGNGRNSAEDIDMLVSDNSPNGFEDDLDECLLPECADADIFQGIRKDEWTCEKVCGYVVCKPKKVNGETVTKEKDNGKHIVQIRALLRLWLEYFLEDYKKIKHKISHCIKNDDGSKCIKVCDNKCKCVEKWIKLKRDEWKTIKDRFNDQYKMDSDEYYPVKTILEELIPQITDVNEKEKVIKISKFDNSCGCSADANSQKNDGNQDAIDCMLKKLEQKATACPGKPSGDTQTSCVDYPPLPDEEYENEEENDKKVEPPTFCEIKDTTEQEEKGDCKTDAPQPDVKKEGEEKEVAKDKGDEGESAGDPAGPAPSTPAPQPTTPPTYLSPPLKTALMSSTIMWSIGI